MFREFLAKNEEKKFFWKIFAVHNTLKYIKDGLSFFEDPFSITFIPLNRKMLDRSEEVSLLF